MKMSKKTIITGVLLLMVGTASAALVTGLFTHTTNADVEAAITIDNSEEWIGMYAGETSIRNIEVTNRANVAISGELRTTGNDLVGITTMYKVYGDALPDADNDGRPEITVPAGQTVTIQKCIVSDIALAPGMYQVTTEFKPAN